jgi:hypothetical protein
VKATAIVTPTGITVTVNNWFLVMKYFLNARLFNLAFLF